MSPSTTSFTKNAQDAWSSLKRHAKEHHNSVNAAYSAYYGTSIAPPTLPSTRVASAEPSPRSSVDKAWSKVKKHVKEHHSSVNAAYTTYYGVNTPRTQSPASSTESSPRVSVDRH